MDILTDPTPADLRNAASRNLEALFRAMTTLEGGILDEGSGVSRHMTFPTNPMFKGAWATRLADDEVDAAIDDTIDQFRAWGAPFFFWWIDPETSPVDLGARLEARGLLSMEGQQKALAGGIVQTAAGAPVMAMDLATADPTLLDRIPSGFTIREVSADAELEDFKAVFVSTYQIPDWAGQAWVDATRHLGIGKTPWRMFVGYLEGEPVATNMLFNGGGVASVYAVATLPKAQGRGIGGAIMLQPLLDARDQGYRHAALFSTEEGFSVYRRLGFADTGARINRYLWRAS
jgi:ribosomal protein S18 acetylase RimI-like enzyme